VLVATFYPAEIRKIVYDKPLSLFEMGEGGGGGLGIINIKIDIWEYNKL
jgi:hypothetical protein